MDKLGDVKETVNEEELDKELKEVTAFYKVGFYIITYLKNIECLQISVYLA